MQSSEGNDRSVKDLPELKLLNCTSPPSNPKSPTFPSLGLYAADRLPIEVKFKDFAWLLGHNLARISAGQRETEAGSAVGGSSEEGDHLSYATVPVWSAYNSLIKETLPVTRIGCPPLLAAPALQWSTLLTVFMQAQAITAKVMGPGRKAVISLDMGLYQPAKKLQMARNDLNHLILRPGELHILMAQLRTLGSSIKNSGIDLCWIESDPYGPTTVKQIIDGNHVKRGQTVHFVTLQALFALYQRAFLSEQPAEVVKAVESITGKLATVCSSGSKEEVKAASKNVVEQLKLFDYMGRMKTFEEGRNHIPMFKVFLCYMQMVMDVMVFIRAVRTGDWLLHLSSLQAFTKYFFAYDRINYARMIPLYLAEMKMLQVSEPDIYQEFLEGAWIVNKNLNVSFCALGADHALEQVNRSMKVSGGLVGITLNPSARTKFFLIAPELSRLAEEARSMAGTTSTHSSAHHHSLSASVFSREEKSIVQLLATMENFTNPFVEQSEELFNLVTNVVTPTQVKKDMSEQSSIGAKLFETFAKERFQLGTIGLWSKMKKRKL